MDISPLLLKLLRIAAILIAGFALVQAVGCVSYRSLLFHRGSYQLDQVRAIAAEESLRLWPVDGPDYRGFTSAPGTNPSRGTVVVFHGNAGLAAHRTYYVQALERLGFRVVLAEYPGYGTRAGGLSEKNLIRDGIQTAGAARDAFGGPLYLWGESLGCAVASGVAALLKQEVKGLILLTPWDNLPALAAHYYPFLPVRLLVRERYDNAANLALYGGPAAILIADRDEVVPASHAQRVFDAYPGPKKLWTFHRAGHNSWPASPILPWWGEVMLFCEQP
jgi:pimeloyl-ACP methyl ester carboxylesterase